MARIGRSIRDKAVAPGTVLDLLGEHVETCVRTREGLTHATVAFSAPDISGNAIIL